MNTTLRYFILLLGLTKVRLSLSVSLSASLGFVLATQGVKGGILAPTVGTFFLACGACALNQCQEKERDGQMERTRGRALPSGRMSAQSALWISFGLMIAGSAVLFSQNHLLAGALGLFAVFSYNGVYTFLKSRTIAAVIPGAVVGAIPPVIGWVSGGGVLLHPASLAVALFFFLWQIPHCWLLLLEHGEDYEKTGLPTPAALWPVNRIRRILFVWMYSAVVSSFLIAFFLSLNFRFTLLALVASSLWFIGSANYFLRPRVRASGLRSAFASLNVYAFLVMSFLSLDRLLTGIF
jgi:protoheme IX farnesyltransferase